MKNIIFLALISFAVVACGDNAAGTSKQASDSAASNTGSAATQPLPSSNTSMDTSAVQGKGTDKIPSRTGTTGQGNTTVTGAATGSPKGTGKDTTK